MGILNRLETRATSQTLGHPRDPVLANWFGGGSNTAAGMNVTAETASRASAVYASAKVLSEAIASLPLVLYKRTSGGGKEKAVDHPLFNVLKTRPNHYQSSFEFIEQGVLNMCYRGASYSHILADPRGQRRLMQLNPDNVRPTLLPSGKLAYEYVSPQGVSKVLLQEEVLRVPYQTKDGINPLSVIAAQREAIGASLAAQDYSARFFGNDARPTGGYMTWDGGARFKDEEEAKKFRQNWQEYMAGANRHKIAVLKPGMAYHELGMSNEDAQFLETRKFQRSEIAGFFRVPPHMIGDLERATFSNIDAQATDFVVHTVGPWLARWEPALSRDLLTELEQEDYFFEFMVDGLLRGDPQARSAYYQRAILTGWMNRNEVRAKDNLQEAEGLDEFIVPSNMQAAEMLMNQAGGEQHGD